MSLRGIEFGVVLPEVAAGVGFGSVTAQTPSSRDNLCWDIRVPLLCVPYPVWGCGDTSRHGDFPHLCPALPGTGVCWFCPFLTPWLVPLPFGPSLSRARFSPAPGTALLSAGASGCCDSIRNHSRFGPRACFLPEPGRQRRGDGLNQHRVMPARPRLPPSGLRGWKSLGRGAESRIKAKG